MADMYITILINDHSIIEKTLVIAERQIEREKINWNVVQTLVEILWNYGELCHNAKEEKIYFPLLLENGMPPMGPVAVMLQEHEAERNYLNQIKKIISQTEKTAEEIKSLRIIFREYSALTKEHIWKENDILYPMGKNFIKPTDEAYLVTQFKMIEQETVGLGGYERFKTLVDALEKESGERIDLLASLPTELINNILDSLPIELTFVDANDRVRYFNKLDKEKIFTRSLSAIGRTVQQCHPPKSIHLVNKIIEEMKAGKRDKATFWIHFNGMYLFIAYYAVRNEKGEYQGVVELVQDVNPYRALEGEKRLLDEE
ncbi:MAG: PAS domain-containing protein [Ignavibacteria bacterium]|nr:PAS domain-containing protein [Ignavibacteria bacterium]